MNPQWYEPLVKQLNDAGALDVWLTPVHMKKNRPAVIGRSALRAGNSGALREMLLRHSTTLGVRETVVTRYSLPRQWKPFRPHTAPSE